MYLGVTCCCEARLAPDCVRTPAGERNSPSDLSSNRDCLELGVDLGAVWLPVAEGAGPLSLARVLLAVKE